MKYRTPPTMANPPTTAMMLQIVSATAASRSMPPVGLEPTHTRLKGGRSDQLSYGGLPTLDALGRSFDRLRRALSQPDADGSRARRQCAHADDADRRERAAGAEGGREVGGVGHHSGEEPGAGAAAGSQRSGHAKADRQVARAHPHRDDLGRRARGVGADPASR